MHLSYGRPGSLSVLSSCKTRKFRGRRSMTARTPILTDSVSRAATGPAIGADGMSCFAGRAPSRMSRRTEPTQIFNLRAVSSTLIVFSRDAVGSNGAIPFVRATPERGRMSRLRRRLSGSASDSWSQLIRDQATGPSQIADDFDGLWVPIFRIPAGLCGSERRVVRCGASPVQWIGQLTESVLRIISADQ